MSTSPHAASAPVIRIALPGVPAQCPECGSGGPFPLTAHGGKVHATCPACWLPVAAVAVTSQEVT